MKNNDKHEVIVQKWEESERGWGTRPDGYSLHMTDADKTAFIKEYWDGMPDEVQDEYTRPDGTSYKAMVKTPRSSRESRPARTESVTMAKPPGFGGRDGWVSR